MLIEQELPSEAVYELQLRDDLPRHPDNSMNSDSDIRQGLAALEYHGDTDGDAFAESRASRVLSLVAQTGRSLEDYDVTRPELEELVRRNFRQAARHMVSDERIEQLAGTGIEVWPLRENVADLLWRGNGTTADTGKTDDEIAALDWKVNFRRAQATLAALRRIAAETGYFAVDEQSARIAGLKQTMVAFGERLGMSTQELVEQRLGFSYTEFTQLHAAEKPLTARQRLARFIGGAARFAKPPRD